VLAAPFQATGFKVGEVAANSAIVWTRLTAKAKPDSASAPTLTFQYASGETHQPDLKKTPEASAQPCHGC
jgi:phosphodiesterase/alkaline phosphatase D-like protein